MVCTSGFTVKNCTPDWFVPVAVDTVKNCTPDWFVPVAVDTVKNCTPDDGCIKHPKHVE